MTGVEEREAKVQPGYVYVVSNVGASGEDVVKIGMARRLGPIDRVRGPRDALVRSATTSTPYSVPTRNVRFAATSSDQG